MQVLVTVFLTITFVILMCHRAQHNRYDKRRGY